MLATKNREVSGGDIFGIIDHSQKEMTYKNTFLVICVFSCVKKRAI